MRAIAARSLASVLAALLAASCGTVRESRQADIEERILFPRTPRTVASPVLEELELRKASEELLSYVSVEEARAELRRMVADPRFHGRQPGELRVVLASWGSGPVALAEIGRQYRAWCAVVRRTNCHEGALTDSSIYEIAFDFAMGSQWDGLVGEVKSTIDPSTLRIVLLSGLVIFMAAIAIPELVSKIPAAAATMVLTAYLGARAVCDLVFGWIQMVRELDAATTFDEVRAAGQRYGRLVGAQTARILILLATAAIAQGGLIARLMKLPRAGQASAALATETRGIGLEAVGTVKEARVLQSGVVIAVDGVAQGAVGAAMAAKGSVPGASPAMSPGGRVGGQGALAGKRVGHTFSKHGSANTEQLLKQAMGSGRPVGQWLDDAAAEQFIAERLPQLKAGAKSFDLPKGLGRMVNPDGSFSPATRARLVPSGSGVVTAFPEP